MYAVILHVHFLYSILQYFVYKTVSTIESNVSRTYCKCTSKKLAQRATPWSAVIAREDEARVRTVTEVCNPSCVSGEPRRVSGGDARR